MDKITPADVVIWWAILPMIALTHSVSIAKNWATWLAAALMQSCTAYASRRAIVHDTAPFPGIARPPRHPPVIIPPRPDQQPMEPGQNPLPHSAQQQLDLSHNTPPDLTDANQNPTPPSQTNSNSQH